MADAIALEAKLKEDKKNTNSLLRKALDALPEFVQKNKDVKTKLGGTVADCIRSGCENPDSGVGLYACDNEAYDVFRELFDKVIMDYHKVDKVQHPKANRGSKDDIKTLGNLDPSGEMIVSTRVRVGRSHAAYPFPPTTTKKQREDMEKACINAFKKLPDNLAGEYNPLTGMDKATQDKLTADHFLFNDSDRFLKAAGGYDDWPTGRGIFFSKDKNFLVWVNEEDHLRLISMQMGGNLGEVYNRLDDAITAMENSGLVFAKNDRLGYVTFCPTNLGTTLRASVHIKIPLFSQCPTFKDECDKQNIQPRGIHGEHTESVGGVYDISNKRRLGLSEWDAISEMKKGVEFVMRREKELQAQQKK